MADGLHTAGIPEGRHEPLAPIEYNCFKLKPMHQWLICVYPVPLFRQESSVSSQIQCIKANKQKLGLAWSICSPVFCGVLCLTTKALFIRRVLFVTCFQYGHCEVLIYPTEPGPALWHANPLCLFSYTHTLAAHFWQEIDSISAANSWIR